jgi:hypothetical protein
VRPVAVRPVAVRPVAVRPVAVRPVAVRRLAVRAKARMFDTRTRKKRIMGAFRIDAISSVDTAVSD